jgi:hypothetical protein
MLRDWRYRAQALLGATGILFGCLSLFGPEKLHASREARLFYSLEGFLIGACAGVFFSLCLAGWPKGKLGEGGDCQMENGPDALSGK